MLPRNSAAFHFFSLIFSAIFVCLLTGCRVRRQAFFERPPTVCEARVEKVPFPCDVRVCEVAAEHTKNISEASLFPKLWAYETALSPTSLRNFYAIQTEIEGWREVIAHVAEIGDLMLVYQRPGKLLVIDAQRRGRMMAVRCCVGIINRVNKP